MDSVVPGDQRVAVGRQVAKAETVEKGVMAVVVMAVEMEVAGSAEVRVVEAARRGALGETEAGMAEGAKRVAPEEMVVVMVAGTVAEETVEVRVASEAAAKKAGEMAQVVVAMVEEARRDGVATVAGMGEEAAARAGCAEDHREARAGVGVGDGGGGGEGSGDGGGGDGGGGDGGGDDGSGGRGA